MSDDRHINLNTNVISFKTVDVVSVPDRRNSRGDGYIPQEEEKDEEQKEKKPEFMDKSDLLRMSLETLASINVPIKKKEELKNNKPETETEAETEFKRNIFKEDPIS